MTGTESSPEARDCCRPIITCRSPIFYLFQQSAAVAQESGGRQDGGEQQMIDRVTAKLGRKLYEVPVGFKWFVDGLLDGSLGFAARRVRALFPPQDGSVWTTDKDGIIPALLAAEITAQTGSDPGEIYDELTQNLANPSMSASKRRPLGTERKAGETLGAPSSIYGTGRRKN